MLRELCQAVGVAPFVVVPGHDLHEGVGEHDPSPSVEDGGALVTLEVRADHLVLRVAHDARVGWALAGSLDAGLDSVVAGRLLQVACEVHNGHIWRRHAECHARQLAVQRWQHLADGLDSARGRGDDVLPGATAATPVLAAGAVHRLLGRRRRVHGRHQPVLDAEVLMDDFRQRREAVPGAVELAAELLDGLEHTWIGVLVLRLDHGPHLDVGQYQGELLQEDRFGLAERCELSIVVIRCQFLISIRVLFSNLPFTCYIIVAA